MTDAAGNKKVGSGLFAALSDDGVIHVIDKAFIVSTEYRSRFGP